MVVEDVGFLEEVDVLEDVGVSVVSETAGFCVDVLAGFVDVDVFVCVSVACASVSESVTESEVFVSLVSSDEDVPLDFTETVILSETTVPSAVLK